MSLLRYALLALAQQLAFADIPVHCLKHDIAGNWKFRLAAASEERSSCGHTRPDAVDNQPSRLAVDSKSGEKLQELLISLRLPNTAETAKHPRGTWTMIYDEGFEVELAGWNFLAFSNFTYEHPEGSLRKHNISHCFETMVGWYRNQDRTQFGCYYASKVSDEHGRALVQTSSKIDKGLKKLQKKAKSMLWQVKMSLHHQRKVVNHLMGKIGEQGLGWKARVMDKWNGLSLLQVNKYAGIKRDAHAREAHKQMLKQHAEIHKKHAGRIKARSFLQQSSASSLQSLQSSDLPEAWDWSNVDGRSFLEPVMDQSECGSCYAASAMRMLSARHKIKQNQTELVPWSINFPLMCAEYNQGCKGGYGILTAKWSQDVGLLPADCMTYNTAGSCKLECDTTKLSQRYRADKHRYIGSYYEAATPDRVRAIKDELYHNGPLIMGLEPGEDFMWYSGGVYKSPSANPLHPKSGADWERVDHAVLLVGYGEENGQKYWKLQNTWGDDWGEQGFFRIAQGDNDSGIESIPEAADVVEDEQGGKQVDAFFMQLRAGAGVTPPPTQEQLELQIEQLLEDNLKA